MNKYIIQLLLPVVFVGCATTIQTTQSDQVEGTEKVVLTNYIDEINITGAGTFSTGNFTITVKPIDARIFDDKITASNYLGGEHRSVLTTINEVKIEDSHSSQDEFELLTNMLIEEGLSFNDIRLITEIIDENLVAADETFVYTNPDIQFDNEYGITESNPFAIQGRYLTVVEIEAVNNSNEIQKVCEYEFVITSASSAYKNLPTKELLNGIPAGSIRYEMLHKLLMNGCEVIPANSSLITHLIYPSFYDKERLTIYYQGDDTMLDEEFRINRDRKRNQYFFSRVSVEGSNTRGYRFLDNDIQSSTSQSTSNDGNDFHFVKIGNSIKYVGFQDFLIHDDIDFQSFEIFTVRYMDSNNVEVLKTPVSRQDVDSGTINVEVE